MKETYCMNELDYVDAEICSKCDDIETCEFKLKEPMTVGAKLCWLIYFWLVFFALCVAVDKILLPYLGTL